MLSSISCLQESILKAGDMAKARQGKVSRQFKDDLSILTETDKEIDAFLSQAILSAFPEANLISEEANRPIDTNKSYTFTLDPIDGTDSFSQGMPGWCVAIGLLNHNFQPVAGLVYAPQFGDGMLLFADIGCSTTCNGVKITPTPSDGKIHKNSQIMVHSYSHHDIEFRHFPGKIRNIGSGVLHICAPLIHCGVMASVLGKAYIWDYVPGHAIATAGGLILEYWDGTRMTNYANLIPPVKAKQDAFSGLPENIALLRQYITPIASHI